MSLRRAVAALAAALVALSASAAEYAEPFEQARFDAALEAGGPVLVEVSAPWCPTCRAQQAILTDLLAEPDYAAFTAFEVDFDTRKDVLRAFRAQTQSTLIVFAGGAEVGRSVGDTRPDGIAALLDMAR